MDIMNMTGSKKVNFKPGNMLYPVPVVLVSAGRPGEKPNLITIAWTGTVCSDPPQVSISVRKERYSYDIIKETGEFVINLVNQDILRAADTCGVKSGRDCDKWELCHLTPLPSQVISAPGVMESPLNMECRVNQTLSLGSHDMFIAEVVNITADERYMDCSGALRLDDARLIAYCHGEYRGLGDLLGTFGFSVRKKKAARKPAKKPARGLKARNI